MKADLTENVRLRRKCLELISRMATKGALARSTDASRCAMRMLAYGIARYNYNDPDMGPARARKELRDLQEMYWWLNTESEDRGKRAHPPEPQDPAAGRDLAK